MSGLVRDSANLLHHLTKIFTPGEISLSRIETQLVSPSQGCFFLDFVYQV